ncbi:MAG: zeta toxin family protein [Planctomycetia bacterium]
MGLGAYEAADLAASLRASLVEQGESLVFETVFSDPVGQKVRELEEIGRRGVRVVVVFIRIDSTETSKQRVAMLGMQGGHDVPDDKLETRFTRTMANLDRAISTLPVVVVFDNTDLARPFRLEAIYRRGRRIGP